MSWQLEAELEALEAAHLRRELCIHEPEDGFISFASNDYLGLAQSGELKQAFLEGVELHGAGSGASRLVAGTRKAHVDLEEQLAVFKQTPAALTFSSGYAAAVGTITSVVAQGDVILIDKLSHASLIDAARLSGATIRVFPHNHLGKLERLLQSTTSTARRCLIVTESVFSMDGDVCPLREIVELKNQYGAWLMLDEAHGIGVLGPQGRGLAAAEELGEQVDIQFGTLSKALGLSGGYVAGSRALMDLLVNKARSFIYTTAPPAALAHAAAAAVRLVMGSAGDERRAALQRNICALKQALGADLTQPHQTAIHPHIVGAEAAALALSAQLREAQILAPAIRYPTVPRGSARLRLTLTALHSPVEISTLVAHLGTPPP